jgi:bifunctional N-acetylglucosamine-1-phosphate-uridyltransferase/glucosamine-1-phosphate-acetyltransferase GlmU-like protein
LAYIHPKAGKLIKRVDTAPLLLNVSLQLAKLESIEAVGRDASSPFAHQAKVAYPEGIASRTTVTRPDCLLAENVTVEEKSAIKECVIGANCQIRQGAKLTRCVLMDGVVVGKGCKLTGCILGKRCEIGEESILTDCEVQENLFVEAQSKYLMDFQCYSLAFADRDILQPKTRTTSLCRPMEWKLRKKRFRNRSEMILMKLILELKMKAPSHSGLLA